MALANRWSLYRTKSRWWFTIGVVDRRKERHDFFQIEFLHPEYLKIILNFNIEDKLVRFDQTKKVLAILILGEARLMFLWSFMVLYYLVWYIIKISYGNSDNRSHLNRNRLNSTHPRAKTRHFRTQKESYSVYSTQLLSKLPSILLQCPQKRCSLA